MKVVDFFAKIAIDADISKAKNFDSKVRDVDTNLRKAANSADEMKSPEMDTDSATEFASIIYGLVESVKGLKNSLDGVTFPDTDKESKKSENLGKQLKFVSIGFLAAMGAATAFMLKIRDLTSESLSAAAAFQQFESETGASAQELQKWQHIADATNNSAQAVTDSIKAITTNQEKIKLGQGDISGYQLLGIDPTQDPFEILEELKTKTKDLDQGMKKNVLGQLGVSSDLIQVLELSNKEFDKMASRAFIIPPTAINTMAKTRGSLTTLGNAVKYLKAMITTELSPSIEKIVEKTLKWIRANEKRFIGVIKSVFNWITRFIGAIINASSMIDKIVRATVGWKAAIIGVAIAFGILNKALLFSPIGLIIAGIVLLVAVLDNLYVYSQGGKSLFGQFVESSKPLQKMVETLSKLGESFKDIFNSDNGMNEMIEKWGAWGAILVGVRESLEFIVDLTKAMGSSGSTLTKEMNSIINPEEGQTRGEAFKEYLKRDWQRTKDLFSGKTFGINKSDRTQTNTTTNNIKMEVNTTANAQETAKIATDRLQKSLESANAQRSYDE